MNDPTELNNPIVNPQPEQLPPASAPVPDQTLPANVLPAPQEIPALGPATNGTVNGNGTRSTRHVEAGRKGARRVHQLIQEGRLYEQEHGLTRGRQRLRQLLQQGKLYEQEHGLSPRRRTRRVSSDQVVRRLLDALVRIARPSYRAHLLRLIEALDGVTKEGTV
jgi:hypothetical protein